jgi:NAD(P)-dependent dehydrogenase (short-subunit alcohol dehydrogenase family)
MTIRAGSGSITVLAISSFEDPAAGLHEDASARLREHPALPRLLDLAPILAAVQCGGHQGLADGHEEGTVAITESDRFLGILRCGSTAEGPRDLTSEEVGGRQMSRSNIKKVAIVTASDSGIGKATAVALARDGLDVGITWHMDDAGAKATAEEVRSHGARALTRHLDLSRLPAAADVIDELAEALGRVDVLVNNAGINRPSPFLEMPWEDWRYVLSVNLEGPFLVAQRAARRMIAQGNGGRIINITSVHEHTPLPRSAAYTSSKYGLGGLTKSLALDLAAHGINVNAVAPGLIATPMSNMTDVDVHAIARPRIPAGRPGDAREVASLVAWLASDAAAYTTGQSFVVDGGFMLVNPQFGSTDFDLAD